MTRLQSQQKLVELQRELKTLQERLVMTLKKSNDVFSLGGDGWHDNPAYDLMIADVDKIGSMIDEVKDEIIKIRRVAKLKTK